MDGERNGPTQLETTLTPSKTHAKAGFMSKTVEFTIQEKGSGKNKYYEGNNKT